MTKPILFNLHPNEYSQELRYYPFVVNLDRYVGSCSTLNDLSNKVCLPNKTEDLNLSMFNMITGINEPKILTKHTSCEYKCKFGGRKWDSNQQSVKHKMSIFCFAFLLITIALLIVNSIYCYLIKS